MEQKVKIKLFVIFFAVLLSGCSSSVRFSSNDISIYDKETNKVIIKSDNLPIISEALKWVGTPYCYGGESRSCTDCSGYVQQVFLTAGMYIPRTAAEQYQNSIQIDNSESKPGDLIFFSNSSRINHVGIYLGDDQFIHASSSNGVEKQSLSNRYYQSRFAGFGRIIH
jgi:cell wall-associated NlpC family hydrolase